MAAGALLAVAVAAVAGAVAAVLLRLVCLGGLGHAHQLADPVVDDAPDESPAQPAPDVPGIHGAHDELLRVAPVSQVLFCESSIVRDFFSFVSPALFLRQRWRLQAGRRAEGGRDLRRTTACLAVSLYQLPAASRWAAFQPGPAKGSLSCFSGLACHWRPDQTRPAQVVDLAAIT
ncbi:hypothetical protein B0T26DRAFT_706488 [Lasiosphaeria miniovina]|uniref:Uncharacterized protein n=1 Tax=Lasiosphaeria miniovina TaxID=1954250 RepID=A0AA40AWY4_9PEZI|nr:uncharacterized protein B0T26DRAFT_706488 [Lasiosphaeria miniovina]KAK0723466.1 hypothetical protein B0T26DRAFT_706488 [Lasiosphaeria miniovina]